MRTLFLNFGRKVGCENCLIVWKPNKGAKKVRCPICDEIKSFEEGRESYFIVKYLKSWH